MVPVRGLVVGLEATEYVTVPLPSPVAPPVIVIHESAVAASQGQTALLPMVPNVLPVAPALPMLLPGPAADSVVEHSMPETTP